MNPTRILSVGKLKLYLTDGRIQVVTSELIELLSNLSPGPTQSIQAAEEYLQRFRYLSGNGNHLRFNRIADRLFFAFPSLPRNAAYDLLRQHSDCYGQCIPFGEIARASARWGQA